MRSALTLFLVLLSIDLLLFAEIEDIKPMAQDDFGVEVYPITKRGQADGPRVLAVVAHPDDECGFAATMYKTSTYLNGVCDIAMITNGEGGFKYSTLAEAIYGRALTDEEIGRSQLPIIRKKEFIAGCKIMHIRNAYMFMEKDHRYTVDIDEIMGADANVWDIARIKRELTKIMKINNYDFVFVFTPVATTHAHHKCASILALQCVKGLEPAQRPIILGQRGYTIGTDVEAFNGHDGYPITKFQEQAKPFIFDRAQSFGYKGRLNYKIIVNWVIAEHKSQGTMQLLMHKGDQEWYYPFAINDAKTHEKTAAYFKRLGEQQFTTKTYGPSAGTARPGEKK